MRFDVGVLLGKPVGASRPQGGDGNDAHIRVAARISISAGQNHGKGGGPAVVGFRQPFGQAAQVGRAFLHPALAQLDLKGGPAAVGGLDDGVHFQPVLLAVMEHLGIGGLGVNAQVADDHGFEQETEVVEIGQQRLW